MADRDQLIESILGNFQLIKRSISSEGLSMNKEFGITFTQASVLFMLKKHTGMTTTEMAESLGVSKSATTQLIDGLAKQALITRENDALDRRVFLIKLSDKGKTHLALAQKRIFSKLARVFQVLNDEELGHLAQITTTLLEKN